jgi:hypothetical protein
MKCQQDEQRKTEEGPLGLRLETFDTFEGINSLAFKHSVFAQDANCAVNRQGFDGVAMTRNRAGPEERIVDRFLRGLDHCQEKWRHRIVGKQFDLT